MEAVGITKRNIGSVERVFDVVTPTARAALAAANNGKLAKVVD